jgi:membrane protease YdiL (CAAX protease family)
MDAAPTLPESPPISALPAAPAPSRPRVWTVFVAFVVMFSLAAIGSALLFVIAIANRLAPGARPDPDAVAAAAAAAFASSSVKAWSAIATAAPLLIVALVAGALSRERLVPRLSLARSNLSAGALGAATVCALAISSTFDAAFGALGREPTGTIDLLTRSIAGLPPGELAVALLLVGAILPLAEELFFRGYLQTRLCQRFGGWPGIVVTSALFGLAHLDWIHSTSAFLIGLYLGWVALRAGSIRPTMIAHAANNTLWVVATWTRLGTDLPRPVHAGLLAVYCITAVVGTRWLGKRLAVPMPAEPIEAISK